MDYENNMTNVMNLRRIRFNADTIGTRTNELKAVISVLLDELDETSLSSIDEVNWMEICIMIEDIENSIARMRDCYAKIYPNSGNQQI